MFGTAMSQGPLSAVYRTAEGCLRVYHRAMTREEHVRVGIASAAFVRLRHPHLLPAIELAIVDETHRGKTLALLAPHYSTLPELGRVRDHVLAVVAQIAQGLAALHEDGILHLGVRRDAAVCVESSGWGARTVLCDGENARMREQDAPPAITYLGQPWIAPELGEHNRAEPRSDVYGLGVLLHELVHGVLPPERGAIEETGDRELADLMLRLLAVDAGRRPSTTDDVLDELEQIGWQRTRPIEARTHDDPVDALQLLVLAPGMREVPLCEGRVDTWRRCRWVGPCELWHYGERVYVAPDDGIAINGCAVTGSRKIPLTPGDVVTARDTTFVIVPGALDEVRQLGARFTPALPPARPIATLDWPPDAPRAPIAVPAPPPVAVVAAVAAGNPQRNQLELEKTLEVEVEIEIPQFHCPRCGRTSPAKSTACWFCAGEPLVEPGDAQMLGPWRIVAELGAGGTAEAMRVTNAAGEGGVAKRMLSEAAARPEMRTRFQREIDILRGLRHVAVPGLLDDGIDNGRPYLVLEDAGPMSVAARLADGRMPPHDAVAVARDVLAALATAHARGVIHRDIKPSNVFLPARPGAFAKLLDFGVAHRASDDNITGAGIVGTPLYMSPEQIRGGEVGPASDIYGVGCLLYEMLAGRPPYRGNTQELLAAHLAEDPPALDDAVPRPLAYVVTTMLAKEPAERPASCEIVRRGLDAALPAPLAAPPDDPRLGRAREVEPGIFEAETSDVTMMFGQLVLIDRRDRRDGPRLRIESLEFLAKRPLDGFPCITQLENYPVPDERWAQFVIAPEPPPIPDGARLPIEPAMAIMLASAAAIARADAAGRRTPVIDRAAIRARYGSPDAFVVQLPLLDDTLATDGLPTATGPRQLAALFFDLVLAGDPPPPEWPDAVKQLALGVRANGEGVPARTTLEMLLDADRDPAWHELVDRLVAQVERTGEPTAPPFVIPARIVVRERVQDNLVDSLRDSIRDPIRNPIQIEPMRGRLEVGGRVGNWRILRLLGTGGVGRVFEVEHAVIRRRAVAKALLEQFASQPEILGRFIDEARAVNEFRHPNIIDVFDIGQDERGIPFMVMELVEGSTLRHILRNGPLRVNDAIHVTRQVAEGLRAAHAAGIVHRDIKPDNLVVQGDPMRVKIIDFGIASVPRASGYATRTNATMGTPAYMPPEQWGNTRETDARGDIYALGITLYEMLVGAQPFGTSALDDGLAEFMHLARTRIPDPPTSPFAPLHPALVTLVMRMIEKRAEDRPQTCVEVIEALDAIAPPRVANTLEEQVTRLGYHDVRDAGMTLEGIPRLRANRVAGPITVYVAPAQLRGMRARARVDALRYLQRERTPLFIAIDDEHPLAGGSIALVRRDPVPPPLATGVRIGLGPALAVAAVAYRALALLRSRGRRFENFGLDQVRAAVADPAAFACVLHAPLVFDRTEKTARTMLDNEYIGNVQYASPDQLMGRDHDHDVAYAVGVLAYELLAGEPPMPGASMYEIGQRKASEDPPRLASRCQVPTAVAVFVDGLISRESARRARPPAMIEAALLELLTGEPAWHEAASRVLAEAPSLDAIAVEIPRDLILTLRPTLAGGERIAGWTVGRHIRYGGDAEVYVVTAPGSERRAILKLWYAEIDPYSDEWMRFRRGMLECARRSGFPDVLEVDVVVRGRPRAFAVLEWIKGPDWRTVASAPVATQVVLDLSARLLATLVDAHALLGVVGDVSPTNVIVREDADARRPFLLDVLMPGKTRAEIAGYGTPGYVAPEVADGKPPTAASDVFSAGVLIAELALARRLFPEIVDGLSYPVGDFAPAITTAVADIARLHGHVFADHVAWLLAIDPAQRPTSVKASERVGETAARAHVRETSRLLTGSSSLLGLERRLPRPIAQALRSWRIASAPQDKTMLGFGLAELIARYVGSIALADYLSGARIPEVEHQLGSLARPGFGTWLAIGRTFGRALAARGDAFVPELAELFTGETGKGLAAIEALIPMRNRAAHGRAIIPDGDVHIHQECQQLLRGLLDAIRFLSQYPLLAVVAQRARRDGTFDGTFVELHGTAGEPEHRRLLSTTAAPGGAVLLASPDLSERLILEPFVVQRPCDRCGVVHHTYVIAGAAEHGDVKYHDQASDHAHRERPTDASGERRTFRELVDAREQLGLRGTLGVSAADAERFWVGESPLKPGQQLDNLILDEEIGRGAIGIVYRARDQLLGRVCAVKIVRPEVLGEDRKPLHRLQDEARKLARLAQHANVVQVFRFGITPDENNCFIVMELLEGGSLEDRLRAGKPPGLDEVIKLGDQLLAAVRHVHDTDIVHRDLKPANVLFASPDLIKVVDFGMARDLRASSTFTEGFATPLYCSPEQQAGGAIGRWTDVYALGLLLFDLVCGRPATLDPMRRVAAMKRAYHDAKDGRPSEHVGHHGNDVRLVPLLERLVEMTHPEPERRPPSATLTLG